jgi:hypothetical protein
MFGGNNPISIIDLDGNEKIVVAASDHHDNSFKFIQSALLQMKSYANTNETKTILLLNNDGYYTKEVVENLRLMGKTFGFAVIEVKTMDEAGAYINGNLGPNAHGLIRSDDLVSNIDVFAHGTPSTIHSDYDTKGNTVLNNSNYTKLKPSSFTKDAEFTSYACRIGASIDLPKTDDKVLDNNQVKLNGSAKSLAQNMANHLNINVNAFMARTEYSNNLGFTPEERQKNSSGLNYELQPGYFNSKYGRHVSYLRPAVNPVTGATTTSNVSTSKYKFIPNQSLTPIPN